MREIKFRTWDKKLKEFAEWTNRDPFFSTSQNQIFFWERTRKEDGSYDGDIIIQDYEDRFILQQATGLKDKNGKEIYEGDIVCYVEKTDCHGDAQVLIAAVIYDSDYGAWGLGKEVVHNYFLDFTVVKNTVEVIGNIFENKDLLK